MLDTSSTSQFRPVDFQRLWAPVAGAAVWDRAASKGRTRDRVGWRDVWDGGDVALKERGSKRGWTRVS